MMPACSASDRFAMCFMPDAAGTICRPCGPVTMASSSEHSPLITCPMWNRVCRPSITSTLANPKSASSSMTSRPCAAIDTAKLAETVVLPTPPLPPVTAITLTGRDEFSSSRAAARSGDSRVLCMGRYSPETAGMMGLVMGRGVDLQLLGGAHQPDAFVAGRVQVIRHPLPVAHIGYFQPMAQRRGDHRAQTHGLVHLGQNAGQRLQRCEGLHDLLERVTFALCGQRQQDLGAGGAGLQCCQLLGQSKVARTHACGVDQDQFLGFEPF